MTEETARVAFIGFGEAASAFAAGWRDGSSVACAAYDIKTDGPSTAVRTAKQADYRAAAVTGYATLDEALDGQPLVFSLVTPDQALRAAQSAAGRLMPNALYLDGNSCSPGTKKRAASVIDGAGGRYVDVAIMAPVAAAGHRTPLLVSGAHASSALKELSGLDMVADLAEGPVGTASSVKMVRSIMVKGLEALMAECVLAGRVAGVDEAVFASLAKTFPGIDWPNTASYMLERMATHGVRRAAEMGEVEAALRELGLDGPMTRAAADWQAAIGALAIDLAEDSYQARADTVLAALKPDTKLRALP
ncbi:MAG: DUF1932 domain-containing protein [Pseudomonadota bacterium]